MSNKLVFFDDDIVNKRKIIGGTNKNDYIPWVEKYRPLTLDDIIEQNEIIKILKNTLKTGEMPHLLFYGPPGTGKTSTILAVATQLFGPTYLENRVIELNASDDRGINIVRNKIITFAKIAVGSSDPQYPSPPFKIVILDEADSMTPEAQAALREVIEKTSAITRFCFICNYIHQIIDPISSRCMKFKFKPIDKNSIADRLTEISTLESINLDKDCISTIVKISEGDVRRSIMMLQNIKYMISYKKTISPQDIIQISGGIDVQQFNNFWQICTTGNSYDILNLAKLINREGYPIINVLSYITSQLLSCTILSDSQKAAISIEICQAEKRLIEGSDEHLQILNVLFFINSETKLSTKPTKPTKSTTI